MAESLSCNESLENFDLVNWRCLSQLGDDFMEDWENKSPSEGTCGLSGNCLIFLEYARGYCFSWRASNPFNNLARFKGMNSIVSNLLLQHCHPIMISLRILIETNHSFAFCGIQGRRLVSRSVYNISSVGVILAWTLQVRFPEGKECLLIFFFRKLCQQQSLKWALHNPVCSDPRRNATRSEIRVLQTR